MKSTARIVMLGTSIEAWGGIASVIGAYKRGGLFERCSVCYLPTHCNGNKWIKLKLFLFSWMTYCIMLIQRNVRLAHVHTATGISFWRKTLFILPSMLFRVPTVLHIHAGEFPIFYEQRSSKTEKWLVRYVLDHADRIIVVSKVLKNWVESISSNSNVVTIHNPTHLPLPVNFSQRDNYEILFLGRLGKKKGTIDLLHAIGLIIARHPNIKLILGGDGDTILTHETAATLGIAANIVTPGWISGDAKECLLASAAIFILPSYYEGLPMSVLEAMSAGLAVISTKVGGIPEAITDGVEGFLVAPGDIKALSVAIDRMLSDKDLRFKMGKAGRFKAETVFSESLVVQSVEAVYQGLSVSGVEKPLPVIVTGENL